MARNGRDPSIHQGNDASCIGNHRRMARRAKTDSNKTDRQSLQKDLEQQVDDLLFGPEVNFGTETDVADTY